MLRRSEALRAAAGADGAVLVACLQSSSIVGFIGFAIAVLETLKQIHGGATLAEVEGVGSKPEEKTDQPEEPRP